MLDELWIDWAAWWTTLTPDFVFLLALPFGVAGVGLAAEYFGRRRGKHWLPPAGERRH